MQEYKKIPIKKEDIIPTAQAMRAQNVHLAMIHAYVDKQDVAHVSYEYEVGSQIHSYTVDGEKVLPSIEQIYDLGAQWAEREIMELMDIRFEGLDTSKRLFMPDSMLSGQGHILVTPMDELIKETHQKPEEMSAQEIDEAQTSDTEEAQTKEEEA